MYYDFTIVQLDELLENTQKSVFHYYLLPSESK